MELTNIETTTIGYIKVSDPAIMHLILLWLARNGYNNYYNGVPGQRLGSLFLALVQAEETFVPPTLPDYIYKMGQLRFHS